MSWQKLIWLNPDKVFATGLEILPQVQVGNMLERNPCRDSLQVYGETPSPPSTHSPQSETTWPATYLVGQTIFQSEILWYNHHLRCLTAVLQSPTGSQRWCNLIKETYKHGVSYVLGQIWGFGTLIIIHWGHYILKGLCLNSALLMSFIVQQCEKQW